MENAFEEWDTYATKKQLVERAVNNKKLLKTAQLKIVAISGVRRSGKTSLLILLFQELRKQNERTTYINLEDNRIKNEPLILDKIIKWFGDEGYLFLDEITSIKDWEGWLSRNHEMLKGKLKLIVSSSRSSLVFPIKELRGRIIQYELYPLSFQEFLQFKQIAFEHTTASIGKIEKQLQEYLKFGGFPEVALTNDFSDKIVLLNSYFKDVIGLDVAEISGENISSVEIFGRYVIGGQYFSASKCLNFFKSAGYKIAKQTILYLEKFSQESYLFFFVPIFSRTIKDRTQYPRKSYLGDTGFLYSISGKSDIGRLIENAVFLELRRRIEKNKEIDYWKNKKGQEVDFLIRDGLFVREIIQVVSDLKEEKTKKREVESLIECAKEFKIKKGLIITKDVESKKLVNGINIQFIPLWKWLLENR